MSSPEDSASVNHNNPSAAGNGEGANVPATGSIQNLNVEVQEEGK